MRRKTGIEGFDKLIQGGFIKSSIILLEGTPGTGKTIFGLEFLYNGATKFNEKGLYITLEERALEVKRQAKQFGWDLKKLEKSGMLQVMAIPVREIKSDIVDRIINLCNQQKIKRLVIDSLSTLTVNAPIYSGDSMNAVKNIMADNVFLSPPVIGSDLMQRFLYEFIDDLKELKDTTKLLISEYHEDGSNPENTLAEFLCDGIIRVNFESMGGAYSRSLIVRKMRETKNNEDVHPVEISKQGIIVHDLEE